MARFLKINSNGFLQEHENTDILTNLTDPSSAQDAATKNYVDNEIANISSLLSNLDWQESVLNIQTDNTLDPGTPSSGDRYIITDSGNLHVGFGTITDVSDNDIVEYDGSDFVVVWDESDVSPSSEGATAFNEDDDTYYTFNGTSWVKIGTVITHNNLSGIQGGTTDEYYHLTSSEDGWLDSAITTVPTATNLVDKSDNESITGIWDFSGGDIVLPSDQTGTPAEGNVYWDSSNDALYVYDGAAWSEVGGDTSEVVVTMTSAGVTAGDAVYINGSGQAASAQADNINTSKVIGFAKTTVGSGSNVDIIVVGTVSGVLSGATAGNTYFLSDATAGDVSTTVPSDNGDVVMRVGYAISATDLFIDLGTPRIRTA